MGIRDKRCTHPNKKRRQQSASEQAALRLGRSVSEQIARLDRGGYSAVRERKKLAKEQGRVRRIILKIQKEYGESSYFKASAPEVLDHVLAAISGRKGKR